jgi:hypothetical protein
VIRNEKGTLRPRSWDLRFFLVFLVGIWLCGEYLVCRRAGEWASLVNKRIIVVRVNAISIGTISKAEKLVLEICLMCTSAMLMS